MNDIAAHPLHLIARELNATLAEARQALETYADRPQHVEALAICAGQLHLAQGALRLVEVYGAALLAEEMEHVCRFLEDGSRTPEERNDALDALSRGMVQLPVYIERVQGGGRDLALVLLPLLNDLRASRRRTLLSEGTLLLLNLTPDSRASVGERQSDFLDVDIGQLARRTRLSFELGLLGWIRGEQPDANLARMARVAEALERAARTDPVYQLWWVIGGVLEALREGGLDTSVAIKRLLGQADLQIKRLTDQGENAFTAEPAIELLNNLLYYVGRATSSGRRVGAIRASFSLAELLPADEQVELARESLSAPSIKLMQTVASAIKEDLSRVKDVLDIYVRTGMGRVDELAPQLDLLKKISDTLGVLGLGDLRGHVQTEIAQLQEIVANQAPADDATLVKMASTLLSVEDNLDGQLMRLIMPAGVEAESRGEEGDTVRALEFRQVTEAVVRECIVNLARVKEAISQSIDNPADAQALDAVPALLRGIMAGLLMLNKTRGVDLVERIGAFIKDSLRPGRRPLAQLKLDLMADAIVSIEYYMETIQAGRSDPWYMLDNAESCIESLERAPADIQFPTTADSPGYVRTVTLESSQAVADSRRLDADATRVITVTGTLPLAAPAEGQPDPEFIELFIEEAREEIASIQRDFPAWADTPGDAEALIRLRRSFHTLKGSGRMVGAQLVGAFAWSFEDLLNRVINGTLGRSPALMDLLQRGVSTLPQLVEQLEVGSPPEVDVEALIAEAHALAETTTQTPQPSEQPPAAAPAPAAPDEAPMDPVLREIFAKETEEHLGVIRRFLDDCRLLDPPYPLTEPIYRACHTLSGSANMAGVGPAAAVAGPWSAYIRHLYENGGRLDPRDMETCAGVVEAIEHVVASLDAAAGPPRDNGLLIERILSLEAEFDRQLAQRVPLARDEATDAQDDLHALVTGSALDEAPVFASGVSGEDDLRFGETTADLPLGARDAGREADIGPAEVSRDETDDRNAPAGYEPPVAPEAHEGAAIAAVDEPAPERADAQAAEERPVPDVAAATTEEALADETHALDATVDGDGDETIDEAGLAVETQALDAGAEPEGGSAEAIDEAAPADETQALDGGAEADGASAEITGEAAPADETPALDEAPGSRAIDAPAPVEGPFTDGVGAGDREVAQAAREEADARGDEAQAAFDPEIAAIFSEEATELLNAADSAVAALAGSQGDADQIGALLRQLHTLKGGARMAGIAAIGDLSHELESVLGAIEDGRAELTPENVALLQQSVDELHHMRDAIARGERPSEPAALIGRLQAEGRRMTYGPAEVVEPDTSGQPEPIEQPEAVEPLEMFEPSDALQAFETEASEELEPRALTSPDSGRPEAQQEPGAAEAGEGALPDAAATSPADAVSGESAVESGVWAEELPPATTVPQPRKESGYDRQEFARVDADLLEDLMNHAGEISIFRSRLQQQLNSIEFNLAELTRTVTRLRDQLRALEGETEAQILHRHHDDAGARRDFDPLELDRYSTIQQLSRALAESVSDVGSIRDLLENLTTETDGLLVQQGRVTTELQNGLMRTRMVPFHRHAQRLNRIVRLAATETGKRAELVLEGATGELDRQVTERMLPPLEHMLRNAVIHGIEAPDERQRRGKPDAGRIRIRLRREGSEMVIELTDDGTGLDVARIKQRAVEQGLIQPTQRMSDETAMELILKPGFSTARQLTQTAGRGVGMDVVASEVQKLGGSLRIASEPNEGTTFIIRLPFMLAISQALVVRVGEERFALPLPTVEGVARLKRSEVARHLAEQVPSYSYGGQKYRFQHLGLYLGGLPSLLPEEDTFMSVVLVRAGDHSTALITDEMLGSQEIVVKPVGPQIAGIKGITGATILGDGSIVIIIDAGVLVREVRPAPYFEDFEPREKEDLRKFALVVDDSITVRRVTQRLLERNGMRVMTAKDGIDAMSIMQDHRPDVILLDIEMPRMDGYELASHVRNDERLKEVPIIMITSRVSDKHRARAIELGVNDYLGKPYQESQLLEAIEPLVGAAEQRAFA